VSGRIQAPRGTYDVLGDEAAAREALEAQARGILERAGYRRIETPAFEATELFARGVGASTDVVQKEMYTLEGGEGESLTLRPEGTAPVCRAYLEHGMHKLPQPVKLWYLSSFFRRERPQKGRFRQFWQLGAEAIGSDDPAVDAELILLFSELLEALGSRGVRLRIGSLGTADTRRAYRAELQEYLRAHEGELSPEVVARIDLNPLRAFDADDPGTRRVMAGAPRMLDRLNHDDREHFETVRELLDGAGQAYDVDGTLVRGLDYYTRTVFEFTSDALGAQSGVGGGGRYDGLIEMLGGPHTPGIGWATGIERILLAAEPRPEVEPVVDLFVASAKDDGAGAFALASEARRAGLAVQQELAGRSLKGQLKQADRLGARYVAILGDEGISLKDMESGEQEVVESASAAVARALKGRHPG
jgi:histidyl-tRNA synthetase